MIPPIKETNLFLKIFRNKIKVYVNLSLLLSLFAFSTYAQTPGLIFEGTDPNNVLDPNNDGYVSLPPSQTPSQYTSIGFPANVNETDVFDILYSEIAYVGIPEIVQEPTGDLDKGPSCAFTDLVQDADSKSSYYNKDDTTPGSENMRFRFRLGGAASNSKGYSILIDTDGLFGFTGPNKDPGATPGNPGFELEIVLRTNFAVDAYNVDNTTTPSLIVSKPFTTHAIKSIALTTVCDDPDYFYDFYLPFSDLPISPTTEIRMVTVTSINPKGVIGNNGTSDIAGVNDSSGTSDNLYEEAIETQTPTAGPPLLRADCPLINGPITIGAGVMITGTNTLETGNTTEIEVFLDGTSQGTTTTTTTSWSFTFVSSITEGQVVTATATVKNGTDVIKGTSIANCDPTVASGVVCTPLATPSFVSYTNGGRTLNLSYAAGTPAGSSFIFNFYDASTGAQITNIDGTNVVNRTSTSATSVAVNNGKKFTDETMNFIVKIDTNPATCQSLGSEPISTCTSGGVSVTPFLDAVEVGDTAITGNFGGSPPTSATLRLIINGSSTDYTTSTTGSSNTFSIDITGLTLSNSDVIKVSNRDFGTACRSTLSATISPTSQSIAPTLDQDPCSVGNITSVSGTSSEANATIRLYTNASAMVTAIPGNLQVPTTTVTNADGSWTITGLNIAPQTYMIATAQNTGETESAISNEVQTNSKTVPTTLAITSTTITEGDASITGASSGLPTGSTIQLYLDGSKAVNSSGNDLTTTTDGSGNFTFTGLDSPLEILYTNAIVTVTATSAAAGSCESDQSGSKVVVCLPPAIPSITAVSSSPICENSIFTVTIVNAQPGLAYQLLDQDNNTVGPSAVGPNPAADITINSDPLPFGTTSLKVRAFKILGTCTSVESNALSITVNPSPTITFGANPSILFNAGAQTVNLTFSGTTNSPDEYKIDFDDVAFTDVAYTTIPASPIVINIPAGLAVGVYTATVTIREPTNGCEKSYPITITILDPSAPTITLTNTNDNLCSGSTSASFAFSSTTNSPTLYSIDFNDVANLQGFTDLTDVTLPTSPITITVPTNPGAAVYNAVIQLKTAGGLLSQEYPITITIRNPNAGAIAGDQVINTGTAPAAFTSVLDASETGGIITYQWQKSTLSATAGFSDIGGATSNTYTDGAITQTTYYKRIANSDMAGTICSNESNVVTVNILAFIGTPMITQIYQFGTEKWIEITNVHDSSTIPSGNINIQLYADVFRSDQTDVTPTETYTVLTALDAGKSILIKSTANVIANFDNSIPANVIDNNALTIFNGGNDIITLSTTTDATSWANRYDVVSSFADNTSYVRIDETLTSNTTYTAGEWVVFKDPALNAYEVLANGGPQRHPYDPLTSEITGADTDANTRLGLHRINITTRTGAAWSNGIPDRSRFVVIEEDYDHSGSRLSARKLTVNATRKLGITNNLLAVTNNISLEGEIRLIGTSQLVQTHTSSSLVSGSGKLLVDQNSTVASIYRYNYMSSPVTSSGSSYNVESVFKDGTAATSFGGIINTDLAKTIDFDSTTLDGNFLNDPITLADYWIYSYAPGSNGRSNWNQKLRNGAINKGEGFIFKGPGRAQNYTFLGSPNDGSFNVSVLGANESYLIGNPFPNALSVKKFIEDNLSSTTATLYFWQHVGEEQVVEGASDGHNFAGYIGGYATRNIAMGVAANDPSLNEVAVGFTLEAEAANDLNENSPLVDGSYTVINLNTVDNFIKFTNISGGVDSLKIRYKSPSEKLIRIKVDDLDYGEFTLPAHMGSYSEYQFVICLEVGSDITITSKDTGDFFIDYLKFTDLDGKIECAPTASGDGYIAPEPYIPIGQGFFIQGDATDGGPILFNNSQRDYQLEGTGVSVFFRGERKKVDNTSQFELPILKLGMDYEDNEDNNLHRQIGISFLNSNSFDFDKGYDSEMYDINSTDIYWKFPNDEISYVIAGVQQITNDLEVPLDIIIGNNGVISISIDEIKFINQDIFIKDKLTGLTQKINDSSATYQLDKGTYTDRFVLAFSSNGSLSTDNVINEFTNIYADNKNKLLIISKNQEIEIHKVKIYSILGKEINSWNIIEQKQKTELKINRKLSTGLYIIKLITDKGESTKKIIIE